MVVPDVAKPGLACKFQAMLHGGRDPQQENGWIVLAGGVM